MCFSNFEIPMFYVYIYIYEHYLSISHSHIMAMVHIQLYAKKQAKACLKMLSLKYV